MSNAKQILAMLRSKAEGDDEQFFSIALQVAAGEARQGRRDTANDLRAAVDAARSSAGVRPSVPIAFARPRGDLEGLLDHRATEITLADVVLPATVSERLDNLLLQQRRRDWLRERGKAPSRRLLFVGPPGSGKTMTAEAFAHELKLPLFIIRLEGLITRYMGETAAKLRLVFDETLRRRAVYLFDEFDAVGGQRTASNDVAEMRRVLNSFLQFMEEKSATDSPIIAATNHPELLDRALLRRFDDVLEFELPTGEQVRSVVKANLAPMRYPRLGWSVIEKAARGLSQAEVARATDEAVKGAILAQRDQVTTHDVVIRLNERQAMRTAFSAKH
ncbi:MAG: putative ATPase [Bradyrhizobium sp.]|nr:putative ATPase [Bradyrhizobium sp.]